MLRRTQVGPSVRGDIHLETHAVPGREGHGGIPSVQRLPRSGDSIEGVGKESIAAVDLIVRGALRLGV